MSPEVSLAPSKGAINRAGQLLVDRSRGSNFTAAQVEGAVRVLTDFRTAHSYPLTKVNMGLRSMIVTERCSVSPTQRLKRTPRIIRKLRRMEDETGQASLLARLEDVGGCRVVVANPAELMRVHRRVRKNWAAQIKRERDYIAQPKRGGYRAIHVVVERDARRIEIQLRTVSQQYWADQIEKADGRLSLNLKDGNGPPEMLEFFEAAGEVQHAMDYGLPILLAMSERLEAARADVIRARYYDG